RVDDDVAKLIARLDDPSVALSVAGERSFLQTVEGDCTVPMAVHLVAVEGGRVWLRGLVASLDGKQIIRAEETVDAEDAAAAGRRIAENILANGGAEILRDVQLSPVLK
ncbi:MAG: hydroxymethylbilane synthase, partial [Myxococcota bacterium]